MTTQRGNFFQYEMLLKKLQFGQMLSTAAIHFLSNNFLLRNMHYFQIRFQKTQLDFIETKKNGLSKCFYQFFTIKSSKNIRDILHICICLQFAKHFVDLFRKKE